MMMILSLLDLSFFPQMPGETTFGKQDLGASVP